MGSAHARQGSMTLGTLAPSSPPDYGSQFITVRVSDISDIEVRAILGSKARRALATPATGQGSGMEIIYSLTAFAMKGHHAAIANRGRITIEGKTNPEGQFFLFIFIVTPPAGGHRIPGRVVGHHSRHAKRRQHRLIESNGREKIIGTVIDITKHFPPTLALL